MADTAWPDPRAEGRWAHRAVVAERPPEWSTHWETSLAADEHAELARLLGACFPATPVFGPERSWAGARPELRVVGRQGGDVVAHVGVVPRFLRAPESGTTVLVGDVGLVAVCPGRRGEGLGAELLRATAATLADLADLGVGFGFLTCDPDVRPFYERCGWTALTDRVVRAITVDHAVEDGRRHGMVLPVGAALTSWPAGRLERNGQEI